MVKKLSENKNIQMNVSDPDNQIEKLLNYISDISSQGHSFQVVVDPEDSEYNKAFWIDGDGACKIIDIYSKAKKR